jgi:hypothetical protein
MDYIKKNMFKVIYIIITISIITLPLFYFIFYNVISHQTYEKKYFVVQDKKPEFIKKIKMQDEPILNSSSLKIFTKEQTIKLFSYKMHNAIDKLKQNKDLFSNNLSYNAFREMFTYRLENEMNSGFLLKETIVLDGPFLMGSYTLANKEAWKYYMRIKEMRYGETGEIDTLNRKVFFIISTDDFNKNGKGLSIEAISIK